jgi:uncharacterized protein
MKKLFSVSFAFLMFGLLAQAQTDEAYKGALQGLLDASGTQAVFQSSLSQMIEMYKGLDMGVPDEFWTEVEEEFRERSIDEFVDLLLPIYQKHLSQEDLEALTAFYQTPVGKKYAEKTPLITQESMQAGQQWGMQIGMKIQQRLEEKGY